MPRNRKRTTTTRYDADSLQKAIEEVKSGISIYCASNKFGIPKETLRRWTSNEVPRKIGSGGHTILSPEEEEEIVGAVLFLARCGQPVSRNDVQLMVQKFLENIGRPNPFRNGLPGSDWARLFEKRHPEISRRTPEILTVSRAKALTSDVIENFFTMYEGIVSESGLLSHPSRIFNLDETGLTTNIGNSKIYTETGALHCYKKASSCGKATFTVLFCASADGVFIPPFTVYKGLNLYSSWTKGGPAGAAYGCSESGWMMDRNFESWFTKIFVPHVSQLNKPVLLTFDGHNSHLTYEAIKVAKDNDIVIICLPPNTSHALQPLDVGLFRPLKMEWVKIVNEWARESRMQTIDKAVFPTLLRKLFSQLKPEWVVGGFRASGLYPINPTAVVHRIVEEAPEEKTNALQKAILDVVSPPRTSETDSAMQNSKAKRRRVQSKHGEVLTEKEALNRLLEEQKHRSCPKRKTMKIKSCNHVENRENMTQQEESTDIPKTASKVGTLSLFKVPGDGNCAFSCIAQAVYGKTDKKTIDNIRHRAVEYVCANWNAKTENKTDYASSMTMDGVYATEREIEAMSKVFNISIQVHFANVLMPHNVFNAGAKKVVRVLLKNEHYDLITNETFKDPIGIGSWVVSKVEVISRNVMSKRKLFIGRVEKLDGDRFDLSYLEPSIGQTENNSSFYSAPKQLDLDKGVPVYETYRLSSPVNRKCGRVFGYSFNSWEIQAAKDFFKTL